MRKDMALAPNSSYITAKEYPLEEEWQATKEDARKW
jgi:hypothetical protein